MSKRVLEAVRNWWGKRITAGPELSDRVPRQGGSDVDSHDLASSAARWPAPARSFLGSVESAHRPEQVVAGSQRECCTPSIGKR